MSTFAEDLEIFRMKQTFFNYSEKDLKRRSSCFLGRKSKNHYIAIIIRELSGLPIPWEVFYLIQEFLYGENFDDSPNKIDYQLVKLGVGDYSYKIERTVPKCTGTVWKKHWFYCDRTSTKFDKKTSEYNNIKDKLLIKPKYSVSKMWKYYGEGRKGYFFYTLVPTKFIFLSTVTRHIYDTGEVFYVDISKHDEHHKFGVYADSKKDEINPYVYSIDAKNVTYRFRTGKNYDEHSRYIQKFYDLLKTSTPDESFQLVTIIIDLVCESFKSKYRGKGEPKDELCKYSQGVIRCMSTTSYDVVDMSEVIDDRIPMTERDDSKYVDILAISSDRKIHIITVRLTITMDGHYYEIKMEWIPRPIPAFDIEYTKYLRVTAGEDVEDDSDEDEKKEEFIYHKTKRIYSLKSRDRRGRGSRRIISKTKKSTKNHDRFKARRHRRNRRNPYKYYYFEYREVSTYDFEESWLYHPYVIGYPSTVTTHSITREEFLLGGGVDDDDYTRYHNWNDALIEIPDQSEIEPVGQRSLLGTWTQWSEIHKSDYADLMLEILQEDALTLPTAWRWYNVMSKLV